MIFFISNKNHTGFRKGYSTIDNLFIVHSILEILKKKKKKMYCCFIDFEKAFDKEWRDGLWYKLLFNYMNGNMHIVILNMYKDTKSCIVYNNVNSNFFYCNNRVRQGVNMSPFLFALYLNDLESFLGTCKLKGLESISRDIEDKFDIYLKLLIHYMLMPPF